MARELRRLGHDVIAVADHPDLRGRADRVHFVALPDQRRSIVTRDLGDFRPLLAAAMRAGTPTFGLVCVSRRFTLGRDGTGRLVRALAALLDCYPDDDGVVRQGGEIWLDDPADSEPPGSRTNGKPQR